MNVKKVRRKIQHLDIDIFLNQILLELIDYLFQFIQIKIPVLNNSNLKILVSNRHIQKLKWDLQWKNPLQINDNLFG